MKTAIITGISGQDAAYLTKYLIKKKYNIIGTTRSYNIGKLSKLEYLGVYKNVIIEEIDLLDFTSILNLIKKYQPDEIYNLSAQSSVGLSFNQPIGTFTYNTLSVINLLEAIKIYNKNIRFYQASSSEMYGNVEKLPINEKTPMHPKSPYGISKAAAHWISINYRESFGIFVGIGILFNHESILRSKNFFIKKVIKEALEIKFGERKKLRVGNINIKRDFGYAPKYVEAIWKILQQDEPSEFIICSGVSISLKDVVYYIFDKLDLDKRLIEIDPALFRPNEIDDIYGDNSKAKKILKWEYSLSFYDVLDMIIEEELALR